MPLRSDRKRSTTLDNIMTGRFAHTKLGMLWQALRKAPAEREEYENREAVEKTIDLLLIQGIHPAAAV